MTEELEQTPEQAADFAALENLAEPDAQPEQDPGEFIAADDHSGTVSNLAGIIEIFSSLLDATGYKNTAAVWNQTTRQRVAERTIPVLAKTEFGRKVMAFIDSGLGLEEMALAAVLFPAITATRAAMIADTKDKQQDAQEGGNADG